MDNLREVTMSRTSLTLMMPGILVLICLSSTRAVLATLNGRGKPVIGLSGASQMPNIVHCELKPYGCLPICGTSSPICESSGVCICRRPPHQNGIKCAPPSGVEAERCSKEHCLATQITEPMVCHVTKSHKFCACFPPQY